LAVGVPAAARTEQKTVLRTAAVVLGNARSKVGDGAVVVVDQVVFGAKRVGVDELTCAIVARFTISDRIANTCLNCRCTRAAARGSYSAGLARRRNRGANRLGWG
jgi:hypothetical protein